MLYDFHQKQNAKKPGSVHATYLLTGKKRPKPSQYTNGTLSQDGADSFMQSAPFTSSIPEPEEATEEATEEVIPVTSIILVKEEDLEGKLVQINLGHDILLLDKRILTISEAKAQLEEMTSIHIYSLEPGPLEVRYAYVHAGMLLLINFRTYTFYRFATRKSLGSMPTRTP